MKRFLLSIALIGFAVPALAETAHTVDFTRPLLGMDGKQLKDAGSGLELTLGGVVANCLVQKPGGSPSLYGLAQRVVNAKAAELSTAEIHAIEECVDKLAPLISGQVDPAVDPNFKFDQVK